MRHWGKIRITHGFTLIELLVVIAILGVLAGLLMPALTQAREYGRRAACINNLRQQGIAVYLYLDEHNECFPGWGDPADHLQCQIFTYGGVSDMGGNNPAENRPLNNYLDIDSDTSPARSLFHCPSDTQPYSTFQSTFHRYGTSYGFNVTILQYGELGPEAPRPVSSITAPRDKVWLIRDYDRNTPGHGGKGATLGNIRVMVLFVDGHADGPFSVPDDFSNNPPPAEYRIMNQPNFTVNPFD